MRLEGFAAGLAAMTLTTEELDGLEDNVQAMRRELKAGDFEAAARLDFAFHQRILLASGNQAMMSILSASAEVFWKVRSYRSSDRNGRWNLAGASQDPPGPGPAQQRGGAQSYAGTRA